MRGRVLIIAGSDSGGGAGIQADLKTVTALGGYGATAVTALTAQNTLGVFGVIDVPAEFIRSQIDVVLDDIGADVIKTGMLSQSGAIAAIVDALAAKGPQIPLVLDPVMVAKGGHKLLADQAQALLKARLIPRATLLTPNIPEAETLAGMDILGVDDMLVAARRLLALGPKAVLVKGGHLSGQMVTDLLLEQSGIHWFESRRLDSTNTHGTGCTLASGIATGLAQGLGLPAAVERARDYVRTAIVTAPGYGKGHGPLNHAHTVAS